MNILTQNFKNMTPYYCYYQGEVLFPCYYMEDYFHHQHPVKGSISFYKDDCKFSYTLSGLNL